MTTTITDWKKVRDLPRNPTRQDLLGFFGVPPDPESALEDNIRAKRRFWHKRSNSNNAAGREKAQQIKELIHRVSEALLRGTDAPTGADAAPDTVFDLEIQRLEDLWRVIQELVFADQIDRALATAREADSRWPGAPEPPAALAWVISAGASSGSILSTQVLDQGLNAACRAVAIDPTSTVAYESKASIEIFLGRPADVVATIEEAELHTVPSPMLRSFQVSAYLQGQRFDEAMSIASMVCKDSDDPAVRAELAEALIVDGASRMLPLTSAEQQRTFSELVATAAWCAEGVAEAESLVRPYRLWASRSGEGMFTGSWHLRSLLAVATGFLSLPIHNRAKSTQCWDILSAGPTGDDDADQSFYLLVGTAFIRTVHDTTTFRWMERPGQWPSIPTS